MPRNNRNTVKSHRRSQRPKWARNPLSVLNEAERSTLSRVINARPEQVGSATIRVVAGLALILTAMIGTVITAPEADARAVEIHGPRYDLDPDARNPFIWVEHVQRRWHYAERVDGSEWMVTRCRYEDSRNCYWNAQKRGNHRGRSFIDINGETFYVVTKLQP